MTHMRIELETALPHQVDGDMLPAATIYDISIGPTLTVLIP